MSQGVIPLSTGGSGASVREKINAALQRLQTKGSGTTRPSDIAAYEDWIDTDTPGGGVVTWNLWDGTADIALGTFNTSTHAFTPAGTTVVGEPQGRLTLTSGLPVLNGTVSGAATIYYALYKGNQIPIYDGSSAFVMTTFVELSNATAQSSTGKAGPAALGPYQCVDLFVWNDAGTVRLTRGPKFTTSATATITIATPGVVTWASHGLGDGATVRFATTGALPTGLAAATDYFVTRVDANSFKLSTSLANQVAGTYIATSGSQSGTHTASNYTTVRGTGAGTSELQRINGIWTNKYDITNGPAANCGTYVGTIYANGSSTVDWIPGGSSSGGTAAALGVWNAYNRVEVAGRVIDSTSSWTYATSSFRAANASAGNRVSFLRGLQEDTFAASYTTAYSGSAAGCWGAWGIGYDSLSALSGSQAQVNGAIGEGGVGAYEVQSLGWHVMAAIEDASTTTTNTFFGSPYFGLSYLGRF